MSLSAPSSPTSHSVSVAVRRYSTLLQQLNLSPAESSNQPKLSLLQASAVQQLSVKSKPMQMPDGSIDLSGVLLGGFELGGTTVRVCLAQGHVTNVIFQESYTTEKPEFTIHKAVGL